MKSRIYSKALILSLSALVIVGSGCERRGKAPVKASTAGESKLDSEKKTTATDSKTDEKKTDEKKTDEKKSEDKTPSANLSDLKSAANMKCDVAEIDVAGKLDRASFAADMDLVNAFSRCMASHGLALVRDDVSKNWSLNSEALKNEIAKLSKIDGMDDAQARATMESRIDYAYAVQSKFVEKYSQDFRARGSELQNDNASYNQNTVSVSGNVKAVDDSLKAMVNSRASIKSIVIHSDGRDTTAGEDESSEDQV